MYKRNKNLAGSTTWIFGKGPNLIHLVAPLTSKPIPGIKTITNSPSAIKGVRIPSFSQKLVGIKKNENPTIKPKHAAKPCLYK